MLTYCVTMNVYVHGRYVGMSLLDGAVHLQRCFQYLLGI